MNLPPRVLVALVLTVLAGVVLGIGAVVGGGGDDEPSGDTATTSTTEAEDPEFVPTSSSIEVRPDWVPKQSSRYSDRAPVVTVTTLDLTTTTSTTTTALRGSSGN